MALSKKRKAVLMKLQQFCYDNDAGFSATESGQLEISVGRDLYTTTDKFSFDETDTEVITDGGVAESFIDDLGADEF